ncbi:glucose-6-phosphate dehydrogenase, partial [Candidatus Poribacteria bacterium]|nr:glucose-6-phosphate dehydrogenase [Candidatus Poribacteria bacterium]
MNLTISPSRGQFCVEERPAPYVLIIFGASGDLTHRKLIPALFNLFKRGLMPKDFFVLGCARTPINNEEFQKKAGDSISKRFKDAQNTDIDSFIKHCLYQSGDYQSNETYNSLSKCIKELDSKYSIHGNHIFYLATPPNLYCPISRHLRDSGLTECLEKD